MCAPRHPNHGGRRRSSPSKIPSLDARRRAQISKSRRLTFARRDLEPTSAHSQLDTRVISGQHACNLRASRAHSQLDTRALSARHARTLSSTRAHSQLDTRALSKRRALRWIKCWRRNKEILREFAGIDGGPIFGIRHLHQGIGLMETLDKLVRPPKNMMGLDAISKPLHASGALRGLHGHRLV